MCYFGRRICSGIMLLTLGKQLLTLRVVCAKTTCSHQVRIEGSVSGAQATKEHRLRPIEHLLFEWPGVSGLHLSMAITLLPSVFWLESCQGKVATLRQLLAAFPSDRIPPVAVTACIIPFLLDPAAALGRHPPLCMRACLLSWGSC